MMSIGDLAPILGLAAWMLLLPRAGAAQSEELAGAEESLRATEIAFAQTMADRDHAAFASFLAEETIFFGGEGALRGKETVAAAWKGFFEGPEPPFSWAPEVAVVLASGGLGLTSGPVRNPGGDVIATFNSVWRREADGSWKIVFDRGCAAR